ncbi:MAG: VOC family protein [Myxococcota bacterium]|jgi:catechol 2,3-dioxygenase-like lactoylglutathione lyase family enzyme|nr:VOC family protein [Myxococcota bacterium]
MGITFNMIGLFVGDPAKMATFYRDVLDVETDWDGEGPYAEFKHEGIRFAMYERSKLPALLGQEPSYPDGLNGTFELAINVGAAQNVDALFDRLTRLGARTVYCPRDEPWKMRSAMVADPEGNLLEIASDFWE